MGGGVPAAFSVRGHLALRTGRVSALGFTYIFILLFNKHSCIEGLVCANRPKRVLRTGVTLGQKRLHCLGWLQVLPVAAQ